MKRSKDPKQTAEIHHFCVQALTYCDEGARTAGDQQQEVPHRLHSLLHGCP